MSAVRQTTGDARGDLLRRIASSAPVRLAVLVIAIIWTMPTAGLLISSLRPPNDISSSGWWTVLAHPFEMTQWTLANYQRVLTADGMGNAFLNSLAVTVPAVVIPITIAPEIPSRRRRRPQMPQL